MFATLSRLFGHRWSDDLRVEIRAQGGRTYWTTREYRDRTWSTGPYTSQTEYMTTGRSPLSGGALPESQDEALAAVAEALAAAGWQAGEWTVTCGLGTMPLTEWLAAGHGVWGSYTVTQAPLTRTAETAK